MPSPQQRMPPPYHEKLQIGLFAGVSCDLGTGAQTSAWKFPWGVGFAALWKVPAFTVRSRHTCAVGALVERFDIEHFSDFSAK